jgi:hypothetical protein
MTPTQARVLERTATSPRAGELGVVHDPGQPSRQGLGQLPGRDLAAVTLAVIRREWVATLFGLSAIFAIITALVSINAPERLWGELAAVSYTVSAVIAVAARRRGPTLAALVSLAGALLAPLIWMAATGLAQPEVHVIIRSAQMLVQTGTPYSSPAALAAAHNWLAYDPYLPALIAFGMPRALAGGLLSDPRIWFGIAFVITFGAALRVAGVRRPAWWTLLVAASPVVALPVAVGGDDLPVLGLVCLGLALADRAVPGQWRWPVAAGLALGLAAAMKGTAWPALAVALIPLVRHGGWRAVGGFTMAVAGLIVVTDGPVVAAHPAATAGPPASQRRDLGPLDRARADGGGRRRGGGVADHPAARRCPGRGLAAGTGADAAVRAGTRQPGWLLRVPGGPGRLAAAGTRGQGRVAGRSRRAAG